jgi:hypothetical protein
VYVSQTLLFGVEISISCADGVGPAYAEKSAAAVAEMAASAESLACHTAPLWPRNVPILDGDVSACVLGLVSFVVPVARYAVA